MFFTFRGFFRGFYPKRHTTTHTHIHTPTAESTPQGVSQLRADRVRRLAQGHLDAPLGGAGDRTSDLPVTSRRAPPPGPPSAPSLITDH